MVSQRQARVWRYVEEGKLLKLKSYLKKHPDLDVNFSQGKMRRSPLQLACSMEDDAVLRLLLKRGADVLHKDREGNTALHIAANMTFVNRKTAYKDLFVPLKEKCPEALNTPNNRGLTPQVVLDLMNQSQTNQSMSHPPEEDPERSWMGKLIDACEDECFETFGAYADDYLPVDEEEEDFGDWADRIRREYFNKKHAEAQRLASWSSRWKKDKKKQKVESNKELHERLQREHEEYLARAARKEEEVRQGKKRQYDEKCAATFSAVASTSVGTKLSYSDIPWPAPRGTVREMLDVMLHGVDRKDGAAFRKALRKQQTLWHPDKFAQRCEARLQEKDKQRILDTVTALSQELNSLAQSMKA
ncbi:NF-kappa-B inhibitor-like protein 1 [Poeciliopsis prolifica]|uniref:NF-kappa-B inhibitor-like protein 1 n=1 Tax=Poeciliopsis prolifica TaxID=188132 RepID=UPI00241351DC|nr:NF-kappa-B inhibitor-like protein 1 [Poeciliopsis prolifica]